MPHDILAHRIVHIPLDVLIEAAAICLHHQRQLTVLHCTLPVTHIAQHEGAVRLAEAQEIGAQWAVSESVVRLLKADQSVVPSIIYKKKGAKSDGN